MRGWQGDKALLPLAAARRTADSVLRLPAGAAACCCCCCRRVMLQLSHDCGFLEDIRVMDYSLLLGVHCPRTAGDTSAASANNTDKVRGLSGAVGSPRCMQKFTWRYAWA